ncbi:hypothetical protein MIND_01426200 [Mycena indigotica]|uniref:Uncharacterized protein n=1 Tax=Mycena indigotica TaxID=2126181 RepID=A0A8H6RY95_9AGAR|nr:uncharacterized protein MIND_01426200 [Mycena indigotica]KAF7288596.1 hypothetical protein MIND_01426200 [Mycena indigotica]
MLFRSLAFVAATTLLLQPGVAQRSTQCGSLCTQQIIVAQQSYEICNDGLLHQLAACNECQAIVDAGQTVDATNSNTQKLIDSLISTCNKQNTTLTLTTFKVDGLFKGLPSPSGNPVSNTATGPAPARTNPNAKPNAAARTGAGLMAAGACAGVLLWSLV